MNTLVHPDGTIKALAEFYGRDFQEYGIEGIPKAMRLVYQKFHD